MRGRDSETVRTRAPLAINNFNGILRAVELSAGIGRLPLYMVVDGLADGRLCRLLPDWEITPQPMYLVHPQRNHPTRLQSVFRAFAIAWLDAPEPQAVLR